MTVSQPELTPCSICGSPVAPHNMARHLRRIHPDGKSTLRPNKAKPPASTFESGTKALPVFTRTVKCASCGYMVNELLLEKHAEACRVRKKKSNKVKANPGPVTPLRRKRKKRARVPDGDFYAAGVIVERRRTDWSHRQS